MKGERKYGLIAIALALISVGIIWVVGLGQATEEPVATQQEAEKNIYSYIKLFDAVAFNVNRDYVDSIDPEDLVRAGIEGMMKTLDPFSTLQDVKAHDRLMEMTEGKYQGLGMSIAQMNNVITVVSPIEGTPAYRMGIKAGDQIIQIDDKPTEGMTTEDASKLMRGERGTSVTLKIKREGISELLEYKIERAIIELKNVPYYGVMDGGIGYVRLSKFSKDSGKELKDAINELRSKNIKGLILDLRSNGGGLLDEAVETANLFLDQGQLIVYTQGRSEEKREFLAREFPVYKEGPLVVLVNEGTASGSEIVTGAVQDWDRGVIIGNTTFGKGLVQQVINRNLPPEYFLKLTVAKYYVPSGRCIQKPEMVNKGSSSEEGSDSLVVSKKEIFHTKGGREVYGGGGIAPDIEIEREKYKPIEYNLERQSLFFDFAVSYIAKHPDIPRSFEVDDQIIAEFKQFLKEKNFTYKSALELDLDNLKKHVEEQKNSEVFAKTLENMQSLIEKEKEKDFDQSIDYIKKSIKGGILNNLYGEKGYYEEIILKTDPAIQKAFEILTNKNEYKKILSSSGSVGTGKG
ncbi:MAG: S41 family peptidase [candidate division Zixibacteria bacterium]|nr:S41 family peptidase [candidate division Zixibacteria bacterium]